MNTYVLLSAGVRRRSCIDIQKARFHCPCQLVSTTSAVAEKSQHTTKKEHVLEQLVKMAYGIALMPF